MLHKTKKFVGNTVKNLHIMFSFIYLGIKNNNNAYGIIGSIL